MAEATHTEWRRDQLLWTAESFHQLVSKTQSGVPRAPSAGCGFPYHISSLTSTVWLLVLTELDNSSTPTQSPTQSLEWHVWSSSSGNNCHAVQRLLSSGASVYENIMGFLSCPISSAKSAHAISFDYWPLECLTSFQCITLNGIFGWVEGQNTTLSGATTSGQSGHGNEKVPRIPQNSSITEATPLCCLMSYLGPSLAESCLSAEMQSAYSTVPPQPTGL